MDLRNATAYTHKNLFWLPAALLAVFTALAWLPRVGANERLAANFWWTSAILLVAYGVVVVRMRRRGEVPVLEVAIHKSHWVQACLQISIYGYWGYYWRPVYEAAGLILAQIVFLYLVDLLLAWSRGRRWYLGFGPLPIIFSTNLFLWFHDDWYFLQFAMVALGALGKEFIRWQRDGRRVHIFNPSAFSLSVTSAVLLLTGSTELLTNGFEIANTIDRPEHIYLWVFFAGLVVQYLFSVTLVTLSAAATLLSFTWLFYQASNVHFFVTSDIPVAVFLGFHLLVTDPSTSPRTKLGRAIFGGLYALSVVALFSLLDVTGPFTFYDKLLPVPLLNLSVRAIDDMVRRLERPLSWHGLNRLASNQAFMAVWIVVFSTAFAFGRVGKDHEGNRREFWEQACEQDLHRACHHLSQFYNAECAAQHPDACIKLAWMFQRGLGVETDPQRARKLSEYACQVIGSPEACAQLEHFTLPEGDQSPKKKAWRRSDSMR